MNLFTQGTHCECCGQKLPKPAKKLSRREVLRSLRAVLAKFPPFIRASGTSYLAAARMSGRAPTKRIEVLLLFIGLHPDGVNDSAGEAALGMIQNTYRPRRIELRDAGLVEDSGVTVKNQNGEQEVVWRATDETMAALGVSDG